MFPSELTHGERACWEAWLRGLSDQATSERIGTLPSRVEREWRLAQMAQQREEK